MRMHCYVPRVEPLERRLLMAQGPDLAALSVEHLGENEILRVQLLSPAGPQVIGIAGGSTAEVNEEGVARLPLPENARRIDLIMADNPAAGTPFVRIELDAEGNITDFAMLHESSGAAHNEQAGELAAGFDTGSMVLPTSMTAGEPLPPASSISHTGQHIQNMGRFLAASAAPSGAAGISGSIAATAEQAHYHGSNTAGINAATPGFLPSTSGGADLTLDGPVGDHGHDTALDHEELLPHSIANSELSSMMAERDEPLANEETVEGLFAQWTGGEEIADDDVALPVTSELNANGAAPQHDSVPRESIAAPLLADAKNAAPAAIAAETDEAGDSWQTAVAVAIAVLTGSGAGVFELLARSQASHNFFAGGDYQRRTLSPENEPRAEAA